MTAQKRYVPPMPSNQSLYDRDFYAWANEQAALLRAGKVADADIPNIAEEIESMGRSEKRELVSRLSVLLMHLLKWKYQSHLRTPSWTATIAEQRLMIEDHLDENPSLRPQVADAVAKAYRLARLSAQAETLLPPEAFPEACEWTPIDFLKQDWFPGQ